MKKIFKTKLNLLSLMIAASLFSTGAAHAQLVTNNVYIYFDSFARSNGPVPLNGTAPDVADATGATWTANFTMECLTNTAYGDLSGVCEVQPSAGLDPTTAYLPFTPQAGHFYTLSCDLNVFADSTVSFGFEGQTNSNFGYAPADGPFINQPLYGGPAQCNPGGGAPQTTGGTWPNKAPVTFVITLDTTAAQWVAAFWLITYAGDANPPALLDTYTYSVGQNPTSIATVGIWAYNGNPTAGDFDNFKLLDTYVTSAATPLVTNNTTIYQDSFSRTGPLNGSFPDEFDATGATWTANTTMDCATNGLESDWDGICQVVPDAQLDPTTAYLPFTPQAGHLYTLTCDVDVLVDSTLSFGFQGQTNSNFGYAAGVGPYINEPLYGGPAQCNPGGSAPQVTGGTWPNHAIVTFKIALDTTAPQWVASFWLVTLPGDTNPPLLLDTYTYPVGKNPTGIATVGMWAYNGNPTSGFFDNFMLVDTVVQSAAPPTLLSAPPTALSALPGAYVPLTATVSGLVPLSYQWTRNGASIPGATNNSYIVANLGSGNAGSYGLVITNLIGTNKELSVTVSVIPATVVTDYMDTFSRSGILSNTAPNAVDYNKAKWDAGTNLITDGTELLSEAGANQNALLPLTVQLGHMYRLSVDINPTTNWLAFGFRNAESSSNYWDNGGQDAWMQVPAGGAPLQAFYGGDNGLGVTLPDAGTSYTTYTIVLDTTSTLQWTATYLEGNTVLAQYTFGTSLTAPLPLDIGDVGLWGDPSSSGGYQNFTLVETVPQQIPPPIVITAPVSNTVAYAGAQEVTFSASGFGETPIYYVWRHDGQTISTSTSGTLTLSNINPGDAGSYTLIISNAYGTTTLPSISLEVPTLPAGIVLYEDSFSTNQNSAPYYLGGSMPDLVDLPGTAWSAADGFIRNGTNCVVMGPPPALGSGQNAYLPFKPQLGHIYDLSVDVLPTNDLTQVVDNRGYEGGQGSLVGPSPDGILAVGFSGIDPINNLWWDNGQCLEWVAVPAYPDDYVQAEGGNGFSGPFQMCGVPVNVYPQYNNYRILLDTSTGNATGGWTITYLENGVQIAQFILTVNQPVAIAFAGLGATGAVGAFRNFSLTDTPAINLSVQKSGANIVLTWLQGGTLLESSDLTGPWTATTNTSPYTVPVAGTAQMFYSVSAPYTVPTE